MKASMLACEICGKCLFDTPLFRINEKGVPGIWRCSPHMPPGKQPPQDLKDLVDQIHNG